MKDKRVKEYLKKGGRLLLVTDLNTYRDGGTRIISFSDSSKFYLHQDDYTLHDAYPTNNENLITCELTKEYVNECVSKYIESQLFKLDVWHKLIKNI